MSGKTNYTATRPLTGREIRFLQLASQGYTSKEIASQIGNSTRTVECWRMEICAALRVRNITEAVAKAIRKGIIE